jgi:hypothetical protein
MDPEHDVVLKELFERSELSRKALACGIIPTFYTTIF